MYRLLILFLLALLLPIPAAAGNIHDFEIVTAFGLSPIGGSFSGGGTFSGTFSVDSGNLPTPSLSASLPAVDLIVTGSTTGSAIFNTGVLSYTGPVTPALGPNLVEYTLQATSGIYTLSLNFVQVVNTFAGGQIVNAVETASGNPGTSVDNAGDAIAIDPSAAPEPASLALTVSALVLVPLAVSRHRSAAPRRC